MDSTFDIFSAASKLTGNRLGPEILQKYASLPYTLDDRRKAILSGFVMFLRDNRIPVKTAEDFLAAKGVENLLGGGSKEGVVEYKTAALPILGAIAAPVVTLGASGLAAAGGVAGTVAMGAPLMTVGGSAYLGRASGGIHHHLENVVAGRNDRKSFILRKQIQHMAATNRAAQKDLELKKRRLQAKEQEDEARRQARMAPEPPPPAAELIEIPSAMELTD
jgi:hypothetical protein